MYSLRLFGAASLEGPSGPLSGPAVQRRRLALLAMLGLAGDKGWARDKLVGYLWPESSEAGARHRLSDSLYVLRQALGEQAVVSTGDVLRLNPQVVSTDVTAFEEAIERGDHEEAVQLYSGPVLDGFYLSGSGEWEHWVESERQRLAAQFSIALEALAGQAEQAGEYGQAVDWWQRRAAQDRYNSRVAVRLMQALAAAGDRAGALEHARIYELLVREEIEMEPDADVLALADQLRRAPAVAGERLAKTVERSGNAADKPARGGSAWATEATDARQRTVREGSRSLPKRFIVEIHRRSLWQAVLIYGGAAWGCFELITTVADTMGLPSWLPGLAIVLFLLGLPVVVATASVREDIVQSIVSSESTSAKSQRVEDAIAAKQYAKRRHQFMTWRNVVATFMVALAVWGAVATGWYVLNGGAAAASSGGRRSIAVLPFKNLSGDDENEPFTNGVHDVILTHLYKIADLRPISRTSVMEYKDTTNDIRQIAEELGVATVLEGGVQRAGDRVLVNVQLIDGRTGRHIWAEIYDRELTLENIFAIEIEIARHIATELEAEITAEEKDRLARLPTDNSEAYDYYLKGEEYLRRGVTVEGLDKAKEMFSTAVSLDPQFALAYAELSRAHLYLRLITNPEFKIHERLDSAKIAAEKALKLDPELPEAHIALGRSYVGLQDPDRAGQHYSVALRLSPNNVEIWRVLGSRARAQGNFEEALTDYNQALDLSPRDERVLTDLATTYLWLRRYDEAETCLDRLNSIAPDRMPGSYWKLFVVLNQPNGREKAWKVMQEWQDITGRPEIRGGDRYRHRLFLRVFHERVRDVVHSYTREYWEGRGFSAHDYFLARAILYGLDDQIESSRAYYDSARAALEFFVQRSPENPFIRQNLGVAYAGLGRVEEAVREGEAAVDLMTPMSEFVANRPSMLWSLAEIYTMVEDYEAAIAQLEYLLSIPADFSTAILTLDPLYDSLRDHPRFQALLVKHEQKF